MDEPSVLSPSSTVTWLRQRFASGDNAVGHATVIEPGLPPLELQQLQPLTPAAVLVPLVVRKTGITVLLTQRTIHLKDHAGQISFPGGSCDAEDNSPIEAALREAQEEVGLDPAQIEVLGCLPEYCTITGFAITPVVALVQPPLNLKLNDIEVAEAFETPLDFLLAPNNHQRHEIEFQGVLRSYYAMHWQGYYIWGATAGMLVSLHRFLFPQHPQS